jgi:hypothetical protein
LNDETEKNKKKTRLKKLNPRDYNNFIKNKLKKLWNSIPKQPNIKK